MAAAGRPDRLERMTNLVLVLLETPRPLSLREIARTVAGYPEGKEACRQAFERDKRALRELGIPIAVEAISAEEQIGYRIRPEDYYLGELGLDATEEQALGFAVAAIQLGGGAGQDAVAKLGPGGDVPKPGLPPLAVLPSLPALGPLHEAVRRRALVRFDYHGRRREVEPYGLVFKQTAWYLVGRDRTVDDGSLRTFRVDRLEDDPVLVDGEPFDLPAGFDLREAVRLVPWQVVSSVAGESTDSGVAALVWVDARSARSAVATAGSAAVDAWEPTGAVRLRIRTPDLARLLDWIVGLGDTAEVLAPAELRAQVIVRLESLAVIPSPVEGAVCAAPDVAAEREPAGETGADVRGTTADPDDPGRGGRRRLPAPQATAGDRLNRLLAILVYLSRVGEARLGDLAARFSMTEAELVRELELAACCGVPPYTPDQLIDLLVDEDRVLAEGLRELGQPRRFTPEEGFALAAAARALLAVPGADAEGALAGALAKLEAALGATRVAVEVDEPPALAALQAAVADRARVEIDYFAAASTAPGSREVDPYQVVVREGKWYLDGWCFRAGGLRRFQVDRVQAVRCTGERAGEVGDLSPVDRDLLARPEAFLGAADAVGVRVAVSPAARFAVEGVAQGALAALDDGRLVATILVSDAAGWFGRLLLRLGDDGEVLEPAEFAQARVVAAERALERYRR